MTQKPDALAISIGEINLYENMLCGSFHVAMRQTILVHETQFIKPTDLLRKFRMVYARVSKR
jgi:hypothetical protein